MLFFESIPQFTIFRDVLLVDIMERYAKRKNIGHVTLIHPDTFEFIQRYPISRKEIRWIDVNTSRNVVSFLKVPSDGESYFIREKYCGLDTDLFEQFLNHLFLE